MGNTSHNTKPQATNRETRTMSPRGSASSAVPAKPTDEKTGVLFRAMDLAAAGRYEKALNLLNTAKGRDDQTANAIGVCLMRLGRFDEAVTLFRRLVLTPGCTWMRSVPIAYKTNYATALLLGGHPGGCVDILGELRCEDDPTVRVLRAALHRWQSQLPFWQKLDWRFGRIEPRNQNVPIDFTPGDFAVVPGPSASPGPAAPPAPGSTAA